jgi:hypothetical protein
VVTGEEAFGQALERIVRVADKFDRTVSVQGT